ncbi:L,D-transpeptidase family protein [Microaerobacter geothermalis]|uniref:L,D-transpeptidase family protein n=1 Tax=Microaerobacter geothermalis TaxID=674972 RepID=UPI001F0322D2|nr:L,D-transpeptidase family protein [Microaerobacter geothermalis]MCF6092900.1 L,D-transpeptidase family protein [Microaerobacter geothermalis]
MVKDNTLKYSKIGYILAVAIAVMVYLFPSYVSRGMAEEIDRAPYILIDLWRNRLYLMEGDQIVKQYPVAPGSPSTPSPVGQWKIITKSKNWGSGFGTRWLGLNVPWGTYGIHGTNKPWLIGHHVSHGCIRMRNSDVEELYTLVRHGTKVIIEGPIVGFSWNEYKTLVKGDRGSLVMLIQNRLRAAGYYKGGCHGVFDGYTEIALKSYQKNHQLQVTGQVGYRDYISLGLLE